jgi:hypothetical protein
MGALSSLNVASDSLFSKGTKLLAEALKGNQIMTELNIADNAIDKGGAIAIADVICDMGAMTSLNLASNNLSAEGAKVVAEAIKVTMCTPAIILVPFSCPSGFSINCCCLLLSAGYEGTIVSQFVKECSPHQGGRQGNWRHAKRQQHPQGV